MKKEEIKNEWKKLTSEITQNKPNIEGGYPFDVVRNRELLLLGQVELGKIEAGKSVKFHTKIYKTIMRYYFQQN